MDANFVGDSAVPDGCRIKIAPFAATIEAVVNGITIAKTSSTLVTHETRDPPALLFPDKDVQMAHRKQVNHNAYCPFKGNAHHLALSTVVTKAVRLLGNTVIR